MTDQQAPPAPDRTGVHRTSATISDPQAIRALAHEARLEALEELYSSQSTRTATELASRCGLTPSAMSYHLRALEKYGFVERSPSEGDGRERRWRAAANSLLVDSLNHSAASKHAFIDVQLNTFRQRIFREVDAREAADAQLSAEPPAPLDTQSQKTRRLPVLTTGMLFLNAEQFQDFSDRMYALIDEFEELNPAQERNVDAQRAYYMVSVLQDSSGSDPAHVQSGTATHP
ncbi:winged helix-turn-helix domain-containing protein [Micrococcus terreus]|uniref:winged helix-turn-helix domain-containing protein n=1 Tax=Micrococcus terreus TaxID=574650 RepID=UPI00254F0295|nr:winged helix-turn-helix domain-containing protein [Micrococcus terreus]MDK7700327.1 winged helix-turn-helix domain-containing protein [Micrococcus terreus]WOO96528.1 winged helix-turn-helix domain-containing protein [Micrococcus terreus]